MSSAYASSTRNGASVVASWVGRDDSRVVRALEEYLAAVEGGTAPSRSDFLVRHAAIAERLAACLDGLEALRSAADGFGTETHPPQRSQGFPSLAAGGRLGDYQILREVGRGGMGVVYEAVQVSLGRRVALKVLPAALAVDPRQLQRFRVEARAAAQLHHSNIVPVFAVDCDCDVHYYAMQFIDGPSLAEVIRALRDERTPGKGEDSAESNPSDHSAMLASDEPGPQKSAKSDPSSSTVVLSDCGPPSPTEVISEVGQGSRFRAVARLGVQAGRALDHAHRLGVVHRDIKPANLMIDIRGNLWITDFGLARIQEDTGLTITGDLLGTLRYMSPEQASGRRTIVDHRADIYALGTTLYELLTLRPAVSGRDRHELIRQITHDDPVRPRRIDARVPRELETIVLKAMAREPSDRYATSNDLADDLQRYLDDKPILARAPTLFDRGTKLARRHRSIVIGACCLLMLASVFLIGSNIHISKRLEVTETQRRSANRKTRQAMKALDLMYTEMAENWLVMDPEKALMQQEVLLKVLDCFKGFAREVGDDPDLLAERALAFRRIGDLQCRLGRFDEAESAYVVGLKIYEKLSDLGTHDPVEVAGAASQVCKSLGRLLHVTIRDAEAEVVLRRAIAYQIRAMEGVPSESDSEGNGTLSRLHLELGLIQHRMGRAEDAISQYTEALERAKEAEQESVNDDLMHRETQALVASVESHLAQARGCYQEAIDRAQSASDMLETVVNESPRRVEARSLLAQSYFRHAWLLGTNPNSTPSDVSEALRLAEQAISLEPHNASYHQKLGALYLSTARFSEAESAFRTVLKLIPDSPDAHNSLAWVLVTRADAADRRPKQAIELASRAVNLAPQVGLYWNTLGVAHYEHGEWRKCVVALERSMSLRSGGDSFDWFFMAMANWQMGRTEDARKWLDRATNWMRENRPRDPELAQFCADAYATIVGKPTRPTTTAFRGSGSSVRRVNERLLIDQNLAPSPIAAAPEEVVAASPRTQSLRNGIRVGTRMVGQKSSQQSRSSARPAAAIAPAEPVRPKGSVHPTGYRAPAFGGPVKPE